MSSNKVVLAFSGGLDTSFCVPWLSEKGFEVTTVFVDTGGIDADELSYIEQRAHQLGACEHFTLDGAQDLWQQIVVPLVQAGHWYQDQYPVLCADRYVVVNKAIEVCDRLGINKIAHGCTAMGNDQVRFDLTVAAAGDYEILSPVRDIQAQTDAPRKFEQQYLSERGFDVRARTSRYTINENLLGVTISGSEIDAWQNPEDDVWQLTAAAKDHSPDELQLSIEFKNGIPIALDLKPMTGPQLLHQLNQQLGPLGVGRGLYTGDTAVGLKGRIAFEAPGLTALTVAHRALEEATCTRNQNAFKPQVARQWIDLIYFGFYNDPLRTDLEAYLASSQHSVNGTVTLKISGKTVMPVAIDSRHLLADPGAVYAQTADWTVEQARGFIRLFGQSSKQWTAINGRRS